MILTANQRETIRIIVDTNENNFQKNAKFKNIKYSQHVLISLFKFYVSCRK